MYNDGMDDSWQGDPYAAVNRGRSQIPNFQTAPNMGFGASPVYSLGQSIANVAGGQMSPGVGMISQQNNGPGAFSQLGSAIAGIPGKVGGAIQGAAGAVGDFI